MWIAIAAQVLTSIIALGLLWKDWTELKAKARYLPWLILLATVMLTGLSVVLIVDGARAEATHKGESNQFQATLNSLLDRIGLLQKQVNTEPLLQQNKKLQQDLADTKKLVQSTKDQLGKPAPKATLEAMFASLPEDIARRKKETTAVRQPDGSIEFAVTVSNTSSVRAGKGSIIIRICGLCSFAAEPARFRKITGAKDTDREMHLDGLDAGLNLVIPLKIMTPPPPANGIRMLVTSRCENCKFRQSDELFVYFQ